MPDTIVTCPIGSALDNAAHIARLADLARLNGDETRHLRLYHASIRLRLDAWRDGEVDPATITQAPAPAASIGNVGSVWCSAMPGDAWPGWRDQLATCEHGAFGEGRSPLTWAPPR